LSSSRRNTQLLEGHGFSIAVKPISVPALEAAEVRLFSSDTAAKFEKSRTPGAKQVPEKGNDLALEQSAGAKAHRGSSSYGMTKVMP
jgi:hypothetical protein